MFEYDYHELHLYQTNGGLIKASNRRRHCLPLRQKITPDRGPRRVLCVVVVTISQ